LWKGALLRKEPYNNLMETSQAGTLIFTNSGWPLIISIIDFLRFQALAKDAQLTSNPSIPPDSGDTLFSPIHSGVLTMLFLDKNS
jgi:hypothetical protein